MAEYRYTVLFERVPEGGYHVTVPALPEICTYGETLEEAREMAADAIKCVLESMQKDNEPIRGSSKISEKKDIGHSSTRAI